VTGKYQVYRFFWGSLDWLFPPVCAGCGASGYRWCPECEEKIRPLREPLCRACGQSISRGDLCPSCFHSLPPYIALRSWTAFEGPIRKALHSLKYKRNMALGDTLAHHLVPYVQALHWPIDAITIVPVSRQRLAERGYNQVALIAGPLASLLQKRYLPKALVKARDTRTQVGLSHIRRAENVAGAFRGDARLAEDRNYLLVDDVATSGATLAACAQALLDAGARQVYALTLARALPHHGLQIV
jgi:ComF family protein